MKRYEKADSINPPAKDLILFVGSSTMENWKTLADDFPGKPVLNRGVSGTKTIDLINYKDRLISPYHPKQILFTKEIMILVTNGLRMKYWSRLRDCSLFSGKKNRKRKLSLFLSNRLCGD